MNFHQTTAHALFLQSIGWVIEKKVIQGKLFFVFIRQLPFLPIGVMKLQRVSLEQIDWDWIHSLEKKYHIYETWIELDTLTLTPEMISIPGFKAVRDYMLTTKTRVIDLTTSETALLSSMKPKTRYNIKKAYSNNLNSTIWSTQSVAQNNDLFETVYSLLALNSKRVKMILLPKQWMKKQFESFGNDGFVVGIFDSDIQLLNVAVYYCSDTTCSYNHNGSTATGRHLMAPTLAVWEGIKEGKRRGLIQFDFDGVFDERYPRQKRFKGFGRFKSGFGGNEMYFYPMFRKFRNPFSSAKIAS